MENIIEFLLTNSLYSLIVLAVIISIRFLLSRAPKIFSYVLWAAFFFRLLCPVTFTSQLSIIPDVKQFIPSHTSASHDTEDVSRDDTASSNYIRPTHYANNSSENRPLSPKTVVYTVTPAKTEKQTDTNIYSLLTPVWLGGAAALTIWYAILWAKLRGRTFDATKVSGRIYESDRIGTAFVCGILRPKIYVPCHLSRERFDCIVCHEKAHIRRGDHIIKQLTFFICAAYWFNPAVWAAYHLMCRDMEESIDETVVSSLGSKIKENYSRMLLDFSISAPVMIGTAFSANTAKRRIKNILSFKRPSRLCIVISLLAVIFAMTACTGSNKPAAATTAPPAEEPVVSDTSMESNADILPPSPASEFGYTAEDFGEAKIVMTTSLPEGRVLDIAHIVDGDLFVDLGDGEIVLYRTNLPLLGDTVKFYGTGNFYEFYCFNNNLTSLDISGCPELKELYCTNNHLKTLDLSSNNELETLECSKNMLTTLTTGKSLRYLYCYDNKLSSLDISRSTLLEELQCNNNLLTELDISKNTALCTLYCHSNNLSGVDTKNNPKLKSFNM